MGFHCFFNKIKLLIMAIGSSSHLSCLSICHCIPHSVFCHPRFLYSFLLLGFCTDDSRSLSLQLFPQFLAWMPHCPSEICLNGIFLACPCTRALPRGSLLVTLPLAVTVLKSCKAWIRICSYLGFFVHAHVACLSPLSSDYKLCEIMDLLCLIY